MKLEACNVVVRFGGVVAVDDVSVALAPGRIVSVVGPNGSGKSTLFNAITGLVPMAQGEVRIDGRSLLDLPMNKRVRRGISRTFQTPRFDPDMTVRETVLCGYFPLRRTGLLAVCLQTSAARREAAEMHDRCDALLESFGLAAYARTPMSDLPIGQIRLVDVARAAAAQPQYLLLDEPAAGLTTAEQTMLSNEVRRVAASGVGVLLVEHNFELVCQLAEHLIVLERGRMLLEGTPDVVSADPFFRRAYLGVTEELEGAAA
ncbi:ATP-binding cassette domain-containing protein [Variovorax sp. J22P168]|uniref:ABC transporter ATP-binding protein n=1 Tax=Variovorax jilinensis TaxID=3053513 RepID=UPI00257921B3|nr:ATP-binding cassette domain-containing protein [Variovorax sp. J22P168]MDM0014918.1 ATP-binding cassette domain-containing protein [Variovorax sp. J22P168]